MSDAVDRLMSLTVHDLMTSTTVYLEADETMESAAGKLAEHDITGAPVVDESGQCVGVLSTTDFTRQQSHATGNVATSDTGSLSDPQSDGGCVRDHMTSPIQTVEADAPIVSAARLMCQAHIHRVIVVDERRSPVGVTSSLDLVAALVNAIDESRSTS